MTLQKLPIYEEMNGGAHRKPASILGAPAIVRHLAFWDVHPAEEKALGLVSDNIPDTEPDPPAASSAAADEPPSQPPSQTCDQQSENPAEAETDTSAEPAPSLTWGNATWSQRLERILALVQGLKRNIPPCRVGWSRLPREVRHPIGEMPNAADLGIAQNDQQDASKIEEVSDDDGPHGMLRPAYEPDDHQDDRRNKYIAYLNLLDRTLKKEADLNVVTRTPQFTRSEAEVGRNSADIFCFWWCGLRMTIRLEMEAEYVTLTAIIDLSVKPPIEIENAARTNPEVKALHSALRSLETAFNDPKAQPDHIWKALRLRLQTEIWQEVDKVLIDPGGKLGTSLGYVFADFRGLITGTVSPPDNAQRTNPNDESSKFRKAFSYPEPVGSIGRPKRLVPLDEWRRDALNRLWPLIKSEHNSPNFEFSASGYLDGRAVFVSALGPQSGAVEGTENEGRSAEPWTPLHYYLHTDTYDEWQLGRLINRMHNVATLRLAAIVRIGDLTEAGDIAEEVAKLIEKADDAVRKALAIVSSGRPTDPRQRDEYEATMAEPGLAIDDAEQQLDRINRLFPLDITARLERSRHYIDRFMTGADVFRAKRIEGFQLYKEFVSRRMNGLFSYIDLLHRRMEDIWQSMSELHRKYANLKMARVNCEIESLTSDISTVTKTIKDEDGKIKKIQDFGEIALIGILMPYYLGSILYHGLEHELPKAVPYIWGLLALFGSIIAIRTIDSQSREDAQSDKDDQGYKKKRNNFRRFFVGLRLASLIFVLWITVNLVRGEGEHPDPLCKTACPKD